MPRKSPPGRRRDVEEWLTRSQLKSLESACALFRVPRHRWQHVAPIQQVFESLAALNLATHLRELEKLSDRGALERAAAKLGLNPATVRGRLEEWPRQAVVG